MIFNGSLIVKLLEADCDSAISHIIIETRHGKQRCVNLQTVKVHTQTTQP